MEVDFLQPLLGVEARTVFVDARKVSMAQDLGIRIVEAEALQQLFHGNLLSLGAGVLAAAMLVKATLIADADAVGVEALGVGSHLLLRTTRIERAILRDVVVITSGAETTSLMAGFQLLDGEVAVHTSGAAMQHNQ